MKAKDVEINRILMEGQAKAQKLEKAEAERRFLEGLHVAEIEKAGPSCVPAGASRRKPRPVTMHIS